MNCIKKYLHERRKIKLTRAYSNGFEWALSAFFIEKQPTEYIEAQVYGPKYGTEALTLTVFDDGAAFGLKIIEDYVKAYTPEDVEKPDPNCVTECPKCGGHLLMGRNLKAALCSVCSHVVVAKE